MPGSHAAGARMAAGHKDERVWSNANDKDGLFCLDYFWGTIWFASAPGNEFGRKISAWYVELVSQLKSTIARLEASGKMTERAKWVWFARQLREAIRRHNPSLLSDIGISTADLEWV
jgi:hypothetical protein